MQTSTALEAIGAAAMGRNGTTMIAGASQGPRRRKGEDLSAFLSALDSYRPTVPNALTAHYLESAGVDVKDDRIVKLVSIAADKFLTEVLFEAKEISLLRQRSAKSAKRRGDDANKASSVLEIEDVAGSLADMRVHFRRKKARGEL